jgi:hypothetical protein
LPKEHGTALEKIAIMKNIVSIIGVDPGPSESAYIVIDDAGVPVRNAVTLLGGILPNGELADRLRKISPGLLMGIEMVASYGMPVGKSVFETARWVGIFQEAAPCRSVLAYRRAPNKEENIDSVCMALCGSVRAKDASVRRALIDRYEPSGGGRVPQIGTGKKPGPLHGVVRDMWSALAVAVTVLESVRTGGRA